MLKTVLSALAVLAASVSATAIAAPMPGAIEAMIREAAASLDAAKLAAIVDVAKKTNPDSAAEIDALAGKLATDYAAQAEAARQAKLAQQGYLEGWSGQGEAGIGFTSGNSDTTSGVAAIALKKDGIRLRHNVNALADYQRNNGVTTREKYLAGYKLDYKFSDRMYAWGLGQWDRDRFGGISRRFTESAGIGYRVIMEDNHTWDLEAGAALQQIRYTNGISDNQLAGRLASFYGVQLSDNLKFTNDTIALIGSANTTLSNVGALTAKLSGALSARLAFGWQRESDPPAGKKKVDTFSRATLVYDF
jgi:putative salt-induced outer membrane protein